MKWSLCHPASFARSIRRQAAFAGRTLWMMETSSGHPYTWIPCITTQPPTTPPTPGGRDSAISLVWREIHYHHPPQLYGLCPAHRHIHIVYTLYNPALYERKIGNSCVFWCACVDTHTPSQPFRESSSLVQMIWSTWREAFCHALATMTSSNTEKVLERPEKRGAFKLLMHNAIDVSVSG